MLAAFHAGMGSGSLAQRKSRVDYRLDPAGGDQWQHFGLDSAGNGALVRHRAGAQRRAGVGQPLEHQPPEIDGGARRALEGDLHDAAFDGGGLIIAIDIVAADDVEHEIGAAVAGRLFGHGDEILGLVVDGDVGAELAAGLRTFPAFPRW